MAGTVATMIALEAEREANAAYCRTILPNYNPQTATVVEMKEYAGCVETLYPSQIDPGVVIALKILFVVGLLGSIAGCFYVKKESPSGLDFFDYTMASITGFIIAEVMAILIAGLWWVFS